MGRRAARATHLGLSVLGAVLYFVFVIPRWWVLTGDIPATLATAGRLAAGVPIAAAAVPVMLNLQRSLRAEPKPPELALRLRAWSAVLHVVAGMLIIATAVAEIWLRLEVAGPWLFAVYGAAGSIAALAILAFVLSFTAEEPPAPPKPAQQEHEKPEKKKRSARRWGRKPAAETEAAEAADETANETADETVDETVDETDETDRSDETDDTAEPESDTEHEPGTGQPEPETSGALLNKRPAGRRRLRLRR